MRFIKTWAGKILCFGLLTSILLGCNAIGQASRTATSNRQKILVKVELVVNGQTVDISRGNERKKLRLIGIDAPAWLPKCQQTPWEGEAKKQLQEKLEGELVWLEFDQQTEDNYDRYLGYLWQDDLLINEWLVQQGLVLASSPREPNTKYAQRLAYAQEWARIMELGIWNWENPMRQTPQEFRNLDCASSAIKPETLKGKHND